MYRPDLDILPLEEIEKEWKRDSDEKAREKLESILNLYTRMGINENDIYFRIPQSIKELKCEPKYEGCFKDCKMLERSVIVYIRKGVKKKSISPSLR